MYCKKIGRECLYYEKCNNTNNLFHDDEYNSDIFNKQNLEEILLILGIKKIRKMEQVKVEELGKVISLYKDKFSYGFYSFNDIQHTLDSGNISKDKKSILIFSKDSKYIKPFIHIDNSSKEVHRVMYTGKLLGYPECCIKKEKKESNKIGHNENINVDWDKSIFTSGVECKLLNPFLRLHIHIPCNNKCITTIEHCEKVLSYIEKENGEKYVDYFFNKVGL